MKSFQDQIGTTLNFENTPKRIISLVPSQTELLYELGLEEKIIGITAKPIAKPTTSVLR